MNKRQARLLDDLVNLLIGSDRISQGAKATSQWCLDFLDIGFADVPNMGYGGLIVPQSGERSGMPCCFSSYMDKETLRRANEIVSSYWRYPKNGEMSLEFAPDITFVACLISAWFDRPVGVLWCLVLNKEIENATILLRYSTATIALVLRALKGSRALDFLSRPIWKAEGSSRTPREAADGILKACVETLGCKAGIAWEIDEKDRPPMLKTLAMVGEVAGVESVDMPVTIGIAGKSAQENQIQVVDDLLDKKALLARGLAIRHEKLVRKAGWRSAIMVPLDIGGGVAGVFAVYGERVRAFSEVDVRIVQSFAERLVANYAHLDRIQQLEDKERKIRLEAAAIESGVLAMEIVHDALNSLGIAQAQIGIVRDKSARDPHSIVHEQSKEVSKNIDNAFRLFQKVRDGANILRVRIARHHMIETIQSVLDEVMPEAKKDLINISLDCPKDLKCEYDQFQIARVIKNMLLNSIYFLHNVRRERLIRIRVEEESENILIKIWDNGPGIYPQDIKRVTDYFFTTKGSRGMGFGLGIASRIVRENHGGEIRIQSTWGKETEFIIVLPKKNNSFNVKVGGGKLS